MIKNAILLAGGTATRLRPFSNYVSKHLLNVNGKPIIDYPINFVKKLGVENLTIVVGSSFSGQILDYVKDGYDFGINTNYIYQQIPVGIAQAVNLCKRFVSEQEKFAVILGDNVFTTPIKWGLIKSSGANIVLHSHPDIQRFGVVSIQNNKIVKIEEKPKVLMPDAEHYAMSGIYLFDQKYFEYFKNISPSQRGEYEITDIIQQYHDNGKLDYTIYKDIWSDVGTHDSIAYINNYYYNLKVG